jgi:hypothetical protein
MSQLFDSLDHSPFREKDLDRNAEEYIVDSLKELPSRATCELVIYLDQAASLPDESKVIEEAIHVHFARRAQVLRRELRRLIRRLGDGQVATLFRESLLIGGWVAMWKPLEIFLYGLVADPRRATHPRPAQPDQDANCLCGFETG